MVTTAVEFAALLLAALLVGSIFGAWLIFDPAGVDGPTYVAQQQLAIRRLNTALPVLGGVTILLTIAAALLARGDRTQLTLFAAAAFCFVVSGLITRFLNQPINAIMITWSPATPPANWMALRDDWWRWHGLRLATAMLGLGASIAAALLHEDTSAS